MPKYDTQNGHVFKVNAIMGYETNRRRRMESKIRIRSSIPN